MNSGAAGVEKVTRSALLAKWLRVCLYEASRDRLLLSMLFFVLSAAVIFPDRFLPLFIYYSGFFLPSVGIALGILVGQSFFAAPDAPMDSFRHRIRVLPRRLCMVLCLIYPVLAAFTAFKVSIPDAVPFYADPYLVQLDRWLHGQDPWRALRIFPPIVDLVIDVVYSQLWFIIALGMLIYSALFDSRAEFRRLACASFLIYVGLGVIVATALSSVGPVFYERFYSDVQFPELLAKIEEGRFTLTQRAMMDYLYHAATEDLSLIGTGISAMPSIHVAVGCCVGWYLTSKGGVGALVGWSFALFILFSSIYTGWHYAVDGYLSMAVVSLIWIALSMRYGLPLMKAREPRHASGIPQPAD